MTMAAFPKIDFIEFEAQRHHSGPQMQEDILKVAGCSLIDAARAAPNADMKAA
jgi:hypothetical protein